MAAWRHSVKRSRLFLVVALGLGIVLTACDGGVVSSKHVKVAVAMPLGLDIGHDMLNAAQLALDEAEGMAGDIAVELVSFDTSEPDGNPLSPELEKASAVAASDDPAVVGYLGASASDQARASLSVLNEASIVQFSPAATWPGLTKPGFGPGEPGIYYPTGRRHFFRMTPSDDIQGVAAARWADQLGMESVYIVDDGTAYGVGVAGIFEVTIQDLGMRIVDHTAFSADSFTEAQLQALAEKVVESDPDLFFLGSSFGYGGSDFVRVLRSLDKEIKIMVPDGMVQDQIFTDLGEAAVEGIYATNVTIPAEKLRTADAFRERYQSAYGKEPPPYAVNAYEAMQVLLLAISRAETPTREHVLDAVANLGEFSGVLGTWSFSPAGDISLSVISGLQAHHGAWTFVQVLQ